MHEAPFRGQGGPSMLASVRAGFAAALVAFSAFTAIAADKPFQRSDLADSAVRLEAQIKVESGQVAKPVATLRSEADAAFARAILNIRANDDRERVNFLERAATA